MSQLTKLHELNGKLDIINDLKVSELNLSLDQQQQLLNTHQQVLDERFELLKQIKKDYIL